MSTLLRSSIAACTICLILSLKALLGQGTPEDYQRAEQFPQTTKDKVFKTSVAPYWFDNNTKLWYRNDLPGGTKEFILVDASKGERGPAFDHKRFAESLSKAAGTAYAGEKLPIDNLLFTDGGKTLEFGIGTTGWSCDMKTYAFTKTGKEVKKQTPQQPAGAQGKQQQRGGGGGGEGGQGPRRPPDSVNSPDGKWIATSRAENLFLAAKDKPNEEKQLTTNGIAGNGYGNPAWSPNSKVLVAFRTKKAPTQKAYILDSTTKIDPTTKKEQLRPRVIEQTYRLPGDDVDINEMFLFNAEAKEPVKVDVGSFDAGRVPTLRWKKDGHTFTFTKTDRDHSRSRVMEVDALTGKSRTIIDEKADTRLTTRKAYSQFVNDGEEIIWMSERDGWNHLYLYDGKVGKVKNQITKGPWVVLGVQRVDEKERQLWFSASGKNPKQDPYFVHHYRVNFDGTGLVALTEGDGSHTITYSPDRKYILDSYSRVNMAPVTELRRVSDGKLACLLERADMTALSATGWKVPEPFVFKGRDGKTDIWGVVYRPSKLDETERYPIIEHIYAGPWTSSVPKTFSATRPEMALAELGFVVVQIDGMGLPGRSRAFHDVSHKNHADAGLPDRMLWISALALKYPYMDIDRVGIYGHSGGGYSSLDAMLHYPDFYKVCVSESGNHDPRLYNLGYSEEWMSYPVGDYYKEQSNITNAKNLKGKLLLVHGEADTNVIESMTTMKVVDALVKANKDFELLILPGVNHSFNGPTGTYVRNRQWDFFVRHLLGVAPPDRNSGAEPRP